MVGSDFRGVSHFGRQDLVDSLWVVHSLVRHDRMPFAQQRLQVGNIVMASATSSILALRRNRPADNFSAG